MTHSDKLLQLINAQSKYIEFLDAYFPQSHEHIDSKEGKKLRNSIKKAKSDLEK